MNDSTLVNANNGDNTPVKDKKSNPLDLKELVDIISNTDLSDHYKDKILDLFKNSVINTNDLTSKAHSESELRIEIRNSTIEEANSCYKNFFKKLPTVSEGDSDSFILLSIAMNSFVAKYPGIET